MELNARELRIGNYYYNHGNIGRVTPSTIEDVYNVPRVWCKAIPLTEEWLIKFGFCKGQHGWYCTRYFTECEECEEEMTINWNIKSNRLAIFDSMEEEDMVNIVSHPIYCSKPLLNVHQLQNLYFSLTGEELTIK